MEGVKTRREREGGGGDAKRSAIILVHDSKESVHDIYWYAQDIPRHANKLSGTNHFQFSLSMMLLFHQLLQPMLTNSEVNKSGFRIPAPSQPSMSSSLSTPSPSKHNNALNY